VLLILPVFDPGLVRTTHFPMKTKALLPKKIDDLPVPQLRSLPGICTKDKPQSIMKKTPKLAVDGKFGQDKSLPAVVRGPFAGSLSTS
jgi:hypothetical protein